MTTPIAIAMAAGAALAGLVLVAAALFAIAARLRTLGQGVDELKGNVAMLQESMASSVSRRIELERKRLEMEQGDRSSGLVVRIAGGVHVLEDRQQFKLGYFVLLLGERRVMADWVRAVLVNSRSPELTCTIDALGSLALEPGAPYQGDLIIGARELAKVNLPYVPDFKFLMESCKLIVSVEYQAADGATGTVEKDLLGR